MHNHDDNHDQVKSQIFRKTVHLYSMYIILDVSIFGITIKTLVSYATRPYFLFNLEGTKSRSNQIKIKFI